ncbi:Translation initiation factor eIF-2B subunit delta [Frankliniella fusca]|uniref:Translation initiation factor eIF2B subunit delta n=1 Tax=Frankliniella fusca TaxID=407009 RepID=A0AAE1HQS8_9NEOP|nr:Translation initiation factor eIF-2B subunit delta [Frankliniella fusca]
MDSHQACLSSKRSKKKKKQHLLSTSTESPASLSNNSVFAEAESELKSPQESQPVSSVESVTSIRSKVEETKEGSSKRKRTRKKRDRIQSINGQTPNPPKLISQTDSIVDISESLIPAVQEAIRLLKASEEQMSCSESGALSNANNLQSTKKASKGKSSSLTSAGELVSVLSSEASSGSCLQSTTTPFVNVLDYFDPSSHSNSSVFNLKDLELLKSARSIGPIYSRSSFSSSATVTSSSLSSQLTSERICSSHLYGGTPHFSASEIFQSTNTMQSDRKSSSTKHDTAAQSRKSVHTNQKRGKDEPDFARANILPGTDVQSNQFDIPKKIPVKVESDQKRIETKKIPEKIESNQKKTETKKEGEIKEKEGSDKNDSNQKSKAQLRAERREKQEAQRAAKQQQQLEKLKSQQDAHKQTEKSVKLPEKSQSKDSKAKEQGKVSLTQKSSLDAKAERRVKLFSHLYHNSFKNISQTIGVSHPQYHMSIVRLGVQYSNRVILGSNARCLALLYTLKDLIADYETPPQKEFSRGLEAYLQPNMDFLQQCRPHSVSMVNALRYIKWQLTQLSIEATDAEARQHILEAIDQYISDQIGKAAEAIGEVVKDKIDNNDIILVYACSSLVLSALKIALDTKRKFHVIVVDSLPWLEGREMLRRLVSMGVQCSYVHLSAASFVMRQVGCETVPFISDSLSIHKCNICPISINQVSKVLLGAHALLANGYVMSRAGTSQVALLAHAYNVPVLVCCETYKFSERVQTDSIVYNELADPDELIGSRRAGERETESERPLANWRDIPSLSLLNLVYDVTPPDLVTAVVTERAILPCTSVPVILRIKPTEC